MGVLKVFVSMPMRGIDEDHIQETYEETLETIKKVYAESHPDNKDVTFELVNSYISENHPKDCKEPGLWYLGRSIAKMADADVVAMTGRYSYARGCVIELQAASEYGKTIVAVNYERFNYATRRDDHRKFDVIRDRDHIFE